MLRRPAVLALLLPALTAVAALAQTTPPPSGALVPPLTGYVGRYLDSAETRDLQGPIPNRTLRAQLVKVAPERGLILMKLGGNLFGVYNMNTFATRVATEPLSTGPYGEKYLPPDVFTVNPERPGSGWTTVLVDGQDFFFDFDYDDHGFFYLAYSVWGWGIVDSAGALQSQVLEPFLPARILVVRDGVHYDAIVSDGTSTTRVYDVSNPAAPLFLRSLPLGIQSYAKLATGAVALVTADGLLRVYASGADLAAGNPAAQTFNPQPGFSYRFTATDGLAIFAAQASGAAPLTTILSVLSGAPGTFAETRYAPVVNMQPLDLHYGAGFIVLSGNSPLVAPQRRVLIYPRDSPAPSDLSAYFTAAYPLNVPIVIQSMAPYSVGGQSYLIAALYGVGDLFSIPLVAGTSIPALSTAALLMVVVSLAAIALLRLRA